MAEVDCEQVLLEIYTYLDGELTEAKKSAIGDHLHGCSHCLEIYEFEAELRHVVSSACHHDDVPGDLRMRIARTIGIDPGDCAGPASELRPDRESGSV